MKKIDKKSMSKEPKVSLFEKIKFTVGVVGLSITIGTIIFYGGRWVGAVNTSLDKLTTITADHAHRVTILEKQGE